MGTVSKTLEIYAILTLLIVQEDLIAFIFMVKLNSCLLDIRIAMTYMCSMHPLRNCIVLESHW
jgi:hypothetical protein